MSAEKQTKDNNILPDDPVKAVSTLIEISDKLTGLMEEETNAVAMSDSMKFMATEEEKFRVSKKYEAAAKEFQERKEEVRTVGDALLDKLEESQARLKKAAQDNVKILEKYKKPVKKEDTEKEDNNDQN